MIPNLYESYTSLTVIRLDIVTMVYSIQIIITVQYVIVFILVIVV